MKLSELKTNPTNPRTIKDDKFKKLVQSLKDFPEMMEKRPLVCVTDTSDGKLYPLGGNMRLKALQELKYKDIPDSWVMIADDWNEKQRNEFIIKDNIGYGEWDWEELANDWDADTLEDWGLDVDSLTSKSENKKPKTDLVEKITAYRRGDFVYLSLFKKSKEGFNLHDLKKEENFRLIKDRFLHFVSGFGNNKNTCLICPPARRHKDWNLAKELTKYIAKNLDMPYDTDMFEAGSLSKYDPQITLKKKLEYDNYIIIDDIVTTGQTLTACVNLLEGKIFTVFCCINNN